MKQARHQRIDILYDFTSHKSLDKFIGTERKVSARSWEGTFMTSTKSTFQEAKPSLDGGKVKLLDTAELCPSKMAKTIHILLTISSHKKTDREDQ